MINIQTKALVLILILLVVIIEPSFGYQTGVFPSINKGEILFYAIELEPPSLIFDIKTFGEGKLYVNISRNLLDSLEDGEDKDFTIFADTTKIKNYDEQKTEFSRTLEITFPVGTSKIRIVGTDIINLPDFDESNLIRIYTFPDISRIHNSHIWGNEMNVEVIVDGEYQDQGRVILIAEGLFSTNYPSRQWVQEGWILPSNPIAIINMKHPSNSYIPGAVYDLTAIHGKYSTTTQWIPVPETKKIERQMDFTGKERTVKVLSWYKSDSPQKWVTFLELCAGKRDLSTPILQMISDIEIREMEIKKVIEAGSCVRDQFGMLAKDPKNISVFFVEKHEKINEDFLDKMEILENKLEQIEQKVLFLEAELAKKDLVIMEQLKVIQDLISKISK
jgi:hypothetical protein